MLRGSAFIAGADLKTMLRQRETILWVFIMPVVFFYFIGTITGGYGRPRGSAADPDPLVLQAPAEGGLLLDELVRKLEAQNFRVTRAETPDAATDAERLIVVVAPGSGKSFSEAVLAGDSQKVTYRTRAEGSTVEFERLRVARAVYGVLADLAVITSEARPLETRTFRALDAAPRLLTVTVETAGRRHRAPSGFEQAIPGTMVMFTMLVSLTSGAILLVIERRLGLLRRLASAPISRGAVVAGKWMGRLVLASTQIAFAMLLGTIAFGMQWGAALPMIFLVLLAWAAFNASLALFLGSLARTEGQTVGIGVLTSMALGALGGCWWPIEITPRWMQSLAILLPTGWTMDAMHRLVSFGDPATAAIPHVAVLLIGAALFGWAGTRVFRYE